MKTDIFHSKPASIMDVPAQTELNKTASFVVYNEVACVVLNHLEQMWTQRMPPSTITIAVLLLGIHHTRARKPDSKAQKVYPTVTNTISSSEYHLLT